MTVEDKPYQENGRFVRPASTFRNFISRDANAEFPAEKGRYALYLSPGCPWAHRTMIVRVLKGLEDIIDLYQVDMNMGPEGWYFSGEGGSLAADPLHGYTTLRQLYRQADPDYSGRVTVPVLWDKKKDVLVNNESSEIIRMLASEFDHLLPPERREANAPGGGLYPAHLRGAIDELNAWVYERVNNGVYRAGFATTQEAYDAAVGPLFGALDRLEAMLARPGAGPYLLGEHLTEADVRLYTTAARFDVAYHPVFLCNLGSLRHDYPRLYLWLRRLYWDRSDRTRGAFHDTTEPYIGRYGAGYARGRQKIVLKGAPLIIPAGPRVLIDPLPEGA